MHLPFLPLVRAALCLAAAGCLGGTVLGQTAGPQSVQMRSYSGQFVVSALQAEPPRTRQVMNLETNREYVRLDATLLPVSCERIKQDVGRQLGLTAPWRGRIYISVYPATSGADRVMISPAPFADGWRYRVEMPSFVNRWDFVRAMVQVLLLEVANRGAGDHSAEIPAWLVEGLSQQLLLSNEIEIILPAPGTSADGLRLVSSVRDGRKRNPLEVAHQILTSSPALSFQQLSWPTTEQVEGEQAPVYRSSAQIFVNALVQLNGGRACLQRMLADLPLYYNWQFAFMRAFKPHFQRPIEVEKWWALQLAHFTGHDLSQAWSADESWQKLDQALRSPVQVRAMTNEMPMDMDVPLQTIIREWDQPRQAAVLQAKVHELEALRLRLATNYVELTCEYQRVINTYLQNRERHALPFMKKAKQRSAAEEALKDLSELDSRRLSLR